MYVHDIRFVAAYLDMYQKMMHTSIGKSLPLDRIASNEGARSESDGGKRISTGGSCLGCETNELV